MEIGFAILRVPKEAKKGEVIKVQMIITHPMEPGTRKDPSTGQIIPAYHLTKLNLIYNNQLVSTLQMGGAISQNPYIGLPLKVEESGTIKISYEDNKGGKWEKSVEIKVT
ncbi:thiosulfate oxidation carrier complex protein SoxZ [Thermocrinis minervae]|uniref:Sulfur compound chelating protein SoxZ n=1 Tax=Thermocrinis minervae TaxID=381751 RepID=A0A1M6T7P2_9AQUI|nr:thiosulfate oxidation carrier complex protein SoxZ [Thermocrinis minervae]SHK53011.1 sulfur compound chelating protein SoxZ [Thermocrinis minervae]